MRIGMILPLILLLPGVPAEETGGGSPPAPELLTVRRVHVEALTGGETAEQIRDIIIAKLQSAGLFVLTEDPGRADAFLRGTAEDLIFNETHDSQDSVTARGTLRLGSSTSSSTSTSGAFYSNASVGENESQRSVERRHEAMAAVRLVNQDGDVIWSTVQESKGGKFTGASAAVADRIARQLVKDFARAREEASAPAAASK